MKQLFFIAIMLLANAIQSNAQNANKVSSIFMSGKYHLSVQNNKTDNDYTLSIHNNLPGIYHIQAIVEMTDSNGQKKIANINKRQIGNECIIYQDKSVIQEIKFKSITIDYQQFGESFCVTWLGEYKGLNFSKNGKVYSYANPFTLHSTSFKWFLNQHELSPKEMPAIQEGTIANY